MNSNICIRNIRFRFIDTWISYVRIPRPPFSISIFRPELVLRVTRRVLKLVHLQAPTVPVVCIYSIDCIYTRYLVKPPVDRAADEIRMENSISLGDRYHKLEGTFPRKEEILPINRECRVSTTDKITKRFGSHFYRNNHFFHRYVLLPRLYIVPQYGKFEAFFY